jgi:hypothetical protein
MAAVSTSNPYGALTLSVQVMGAGETETQLAAGAVVVAFVDELNRGRKYNPYDWGFAPTTGDAANKWLPTVGVITPALAPDGSGNVGTYRVTLAPGSSDTVNVASVQTVVVDRNALVIVATGTF